MKKRVLLGMILMASMSFHSCTKEIVIVQEGGEGIENPAGPDGQVLTLQVANAGDGLSSRAGRPLLSSQAKQDIDNIILYVVNEESKVVLQKTIGAGEWANALDYSNINGHGKQLQITFRGSDKQKLEGSTEGVEYTIYAVGYKATSNYVTNFGVTGASTTTNNESTVSFTETSFATTLTANGTAADEIFAGKTEIKVVDKDAETSYIVSGSASDVNTKVVPTLVLNRQVAGVTGYFTNLPVKPYQDAPAKIRLVASNKSNKVHFTSMVAGETDKAAESGTTNVTSIVNGSLVENTSSNGAHSKGKYRNGTEGYVVYELDLSQFFKFIGKQYKEMFGGESTEVLTFADMDLDEDGVVGYKDAQCYVYGIDGEDGSVTFEDLQETNDDDVTYLAATWAQAIKGEKVTVNSKEVQAKKLSDFWQNPNEKIQTLVAGSVFGGQFIIPFLQTTANTFELQLLSADGNIMKNWNIQVPKGDMITTGDNHLAAGITGGTWTKDTSTLIYNVYRNHLYNLGMKTNDIEDGGEPGTDPVDPKPEPDPDGGGENPDPEDQPEDLSKGQDLLLNVNDNWEIIHQMIID